MSSLTPSEEINLQRTEIELLKRDVSAISKLCEKMDMTIDKLQVVASDMSRIVSLQEQKMNLQDKINDEVEKALENNQKMHYDDIKEINNRIGSVKEELTQKIDRVESTILEQLEKQTDEISKKINTIDTWRYMVMGGIAIAVFILTELMKLDITKLIR